MRLGLLAAFLALGTLSACGGAPADVPVAAPAPTATTARAPRPRAAPAMCGDLSVRTLGRAADPGLTELSGLTFSRRDPRVLWAHNDSGDGPRLFALRADGTSLGATAVTGATAVDWEDVATGPGGDLYVGDIGDNDAVRATVDVFRVAEPAPGAAATAPAQRLRLRYPDGPHDAETLLVGPRTGEVVLITKALGGGSRVYVAARPSPRRTTTLRFVTELRLGLGGLATGGSVSADGRVVVVRTYTGLVAWAKRPGVTLRRALRRTPCSGDVDLADEGQGESIALTPGGHGFVTAPEGAHPVLRRYAAAG